MGNYDKNLLIIVIVVVIIIVVVWLWWSLNSVCSKPVPEQVTDVAITSIGEGLVLIKWQPIVNAVKYQIKTSDGRVFDTEKTSIELEVCSPIQFEVIAMNQCGVWKGIPDKHNATSDCIVNQIEAWIETDNCLSFVVQWKKPRCCTAVNIFADSVLIDTFDATLEVAHLDPIAPGIEVTIQCESACGVGDILILRP